MPAHETWRCNYCGRDKRESWHDVHCNRYPEHAPMRNGQERDSHDGCDVCRDQEEAFRQLRPNPSYDPHIDYPERYTDGRPI